jgi:hypothetical protein
MPRFDPTEFGRLLARLTPQELRQVEGLVADARKRAEAVLEIDARADAGGPAASCPRCGSDARIRWGRTRTEAHSDGTARGAGRRGQAAAERRWPGFTAPTWWSRWRVT